MTKAIDKEKRRKELEKQIADARGQIRAFQDANKCFFFKPFVWQNKLFDMVRRHNITVVAAPNKIGKSGSGANVVISWVLGYEPWNTVDRTYPGAVKQGETYYKPSTLGLSPPVKIRITGEDWKHHLGQVVVPELKKWAPQGIYETRRNEQGVEYFWTFQNKSTFELLTYTQDFDLSESWMGHGWWADEPPPKPLFGAMSRGIFLTGGKVLIGMTPLKEVWVLDELVLSGRSDVGIMDDLLITDNDELRADETNCLKDMGLSDAQIMEYFNILLWADKSKGKFVEDRGKAAKKFVDKCIPLDKQDKIGKLKLLRFVQDIHPDDAPSRLGGRFKALSGQILKKFRKDIHWVEPFDVPMDWPVVAMIDFHLSKPQAISYHAVNKQDIHYIIKERWEHLSAEEIADAIIRDKTANAWRLDEVFIDPLAKGDTAYIRNRAGEDLEDSYSIIERRLAEYDIILHVASKDKVSGIMNIQKHLEGINKLPTYYVFNTCERHIFEIFRWVYDEDGLPAKEHDDMMENWYRATLTGLSWEPMHPKARATDVPRGTMAWMGL